MVIEYLVTCIDQMSLCSPIVEMLKNWEQDEVIVTAFVGIFISVMENLLHIAMHFRNQISIIIFIL